MKHTQVCLFTYGHDKLMTTKLGFHLLGRMYVSADNSIEWFKFCTGNISPQLYWQQSMFDFNTAMVRFLRNELGAKQLINA
jgi:hypothetical protein